MADLQTFVTRQKERQLSRMIRNPKYLVFSQFDGTPPSNNAANKSLSHACERAGIQVVTFHALRHTHVSIILYRGIDIASVAKRVGHSSPTTTMEVYTHVIQELQHKSYQISDNVIAELFS
ncbi:Phage integrase family protein [Pisciglobus halotolerans]|uniref:Phage integrase family protein n=1 Tax=Pisciglobus halotolerans TaxID=745365 RepID=A0A1I3DBN1_9LACT|nr:Phage integrase family protein [Pisciglobus halotolerans]